MSESDGNPPRDSEAQRSRITRYLKKGGVLVRDAIGGAIGVRWTNAARTGVEFDSGECEHRLAAGKLQQVPGSRAAFRLTPPPQLMMA